MIHTFTKVTIVKIRKPQSKVLNDDLQWFCQTLGLFGLRDKNSSCFRVFIELLKAAKGNYPLTSDELAYRCELSRGTVVHHLTKLIASGLVSIEDNKYILRVSNLEELVSEIEKDTKRVFEGLYDIAKDIDDQMGLETRRDEGDVKDVM